LAIEGSSVLTFAGRGLCGEAIIPAWPIQAISDRLSCPTEAILHPVCEGILGIGLLALGEAAGCLHPSSL